MLIETQRLMAMLISYIKVRENISITNQEKDLSVLYYGFCQEIELYFDQIGLTENIADIAPHELVQLMETTDAKERTRSIINNYSRMIAAILRNGE
jgi:hypothetical protein